MMTDTYDLEMAIRYLARAINGLSEKIESKDEHSEHDVLDALKNFPPTLEELDKLYERLEEIAEKFHPEKKINICELRIPLTNNNYGETLLGGLMLDNSKFDVVAERVSACHFPEQRQRDIFKSMQKLRKNNQPFDTLSIAEELKVANKVDLNMEIYLFDLAKNTPGEAIPHLPTIANVVWSNSHHRMRSKK